MIAGDKGNIRKKQNKNDRLKIESGWSNLVCNVGVFLQNCPSVFEFILCSWNNCGVIFAVVNGLTSVAPHPP